MVDIPMADNTTTARLTAEQRKARYPLVDAGNEILLQLYQAIDAAPDHQKRDLILQHQRFCELWNKALATAVE